jgi:hypothetical protein
MWIERTLCRERISAANSPLAADFSRELAASGKTAVADKIGNGLLSIRDELKVPSEAELLQGAPQHGYIVIVIFRDQHDGQVLQLWHA